MSRFIYVFLAIFITFTFSACGEGDSSSDETQAVVEQAPVNKQAITFPDLPSMNAPVPDTVQIEENN